jgi:curved DNA-binding protein CbpA
MHYFDILQVTERNSDEETRTRYADLAKEHHPDKLRPGAALELVEARREIFALISEAFDALQTEAQRYAYAHDLEQGKVGSTDDLLKAQNVLRAETLFKKGGILFKMRRYDEALAHLDEAVTLKPDDNEFKVFRAYYGYRLTSKTGSDPEAAQKSIKTILGLMKNDANIAAGYLFLGHLNKEIGKPDLAGRYFEKVLEYDEKNQEALREVRLANLRQEKGKKKRLF